MRSFEFDSTAAEIFCASDHVISKDALAFSIYQVLSSRSNQIFLYYISSDAVPHPQRTTFTYPFEHRDNHEATNPSNP